MSRNVWSFACYGKQVLLHLDLWEMGRFELLSGLNVVNQVVG